jgi:hypothetical protein
MKVPAEMEIKGKSAIAEGKSVLSTDPRYIDADKWLPGSRTGVVLRTLPPVVNSAAPAPITAIAAPKSDLAEPAPAQESGVFLEHSDLEELFTLVRNGSKLYFVR